MLPGKRENKETQTFMSTEYERKQKQLVDNQQYGHDQRQRETEVEGACEGGSMVVGRDMTWGDEHHTRHR